MKLVFADYGKYKQIHFVGIGGVSMSALAEIMYDRGHVVTGSDVAVGPAIEHFNKIGIPVTIGHFPENVKNADLVVFTAAIAKNNVELIEAKRLGIPIVERSVFLGYILQGYDCPIGVAGTHGKTTTTSMISQILIKADASPTVLIGGTLPLIGHNYKIGNSPYIVYEACEYVDSFLNFESRITVLLNVDNDHLDYFKDLSGVKKSFAEFAALTKPGGIVIANKDDENLCDAIRKYHGTVEFFSINDRSATYYANIFSSRGNPSFKVYERGELLGVISLKVPGKYNVHNALAAISAARQLDVGFEIIKEGLESFVGANRRYEHKGSFNGVDVVDDYAHHPTEIKATLKASKKLGIHRVWCVFQPHTYSRTKKHFQDFVEALSYADKVILLDIYAAREAVDSTINSQMIANEIEDALYFKSFDEAKAYLFANTEPGDVVITMGAGNVYKLGEELIQEAAKNPKPKIE